MLPGLGYLGTHGVEHDLFTNVLHPRQRHAACNAACTMQQSDRQRADQSAPVPLARMVRESYKGVRAIHDYTFLLKRELWHDGLTGREWEEFD